MPLIKLCAFDELDEVDSRGFFITELTPPRNIFIVRSKENIFGYENNCPHTMGPLDWSPNEFLNYDKDYIQCANHGALFEIADGRCIYGPCAGQSLWSIELQIDNGIVFAVL